MKALLTLLILCILTGCASPNMNRKPDRQITVVDADTEKPVPRISLVYTHLKKPFWIVGTVLVSSEEKTTPGVVSCLGMDFSLCFWAFREVLGSILNVGSAQFFQSIRDGQMDYSAGDSSAEISVPLG